MKSNMRRVIPSLGLVGVALGLWAALAHAQTQATFRPDSLAIGVGTKTATAASGAATLTLGSGLVTTEALTTAAGATYTLTVTDAAVAASDLAFASVQLGTATTGAPCISRVTPGAGSLAIVVQNVAASAAVNGTLKVAFIVVKQ